MPADAHPQDATRITLSPDGLLRIEQELIEDDRSGPWESTRVFALPGGALLAHATSRGYAPAPPRFPAHGVVELPLTDRSGQWRQVRIDAMARGFRLLPGEVDEPLALLSKRLGLDEPAAHYTPPPAVVSAAQTFVMLLTSFGCLVFVLGGLWMMWSGHTAKDRWTGLAGVVFFGACMWVSLSETRSRR